MSCVQACDLLLGDRRVAVARHVDEGEAPADVEEVELLGAARRVRGAGQRVAPGERVDEARLADVGAPREGDLHRAHGRQAVERIAAQKKSAAPAKSLRPGSRNGSSGAGSGAGSVIGALSAPAASAARARRRLRRGDPAGGARLRLRRAPGRVSCRGSARGPILGMGEATRAHARNGPRADPRHGRMRTGSCPERLDRAQAPDLGLGARDQVRGPPVPGIRRGRRRGGRTIVLPRLGRGVSDRSALRGRLRHLRRPPAGAARRSWIAMSFSSPRISCRAASPSSAALRRFLARRPPNRLAKNSAP